MRHWLAIYKGWYEKHILVVDDAVIISRLLAPRPALSRYKVSIARFDQNGIDRDREDPPDLVTIDVFMPSGDGREVIRTIRGKYPTTRFLALSGAAGGNLLWPASAKLRLYRGEHFRYRRRDWDQEFVSIRLLIVLF